MIEDGVRIELNQTRAEVVVSRLELGPERPTLITALDMGSGSDPRDIALTKDQRRLVITDYFLNEDNFGWIDRRVVDDRFDSLNMARNENSTEI